MSMPAQAEASYKAGDRVMATGHFHRKCAAKIESIPSPGFARLSFDRSACGDSAQPYSLHSLQSFSPVKKYKGLQPGDTVMLNGFMDGKCSGQVKEISSTGFAAVDLDSLFCADSEALYKTSLLTHVNYVSEAEPFSLGQAVSTSGIHKEESCAGHIQKLTSNGFAAISFDALTCAHPGKLYSLDQLKAVVAPKVRKQASGEAIFQRVMREIASAKTKKGRKQAKL
jgi:hypothetical protein